MIPTLMGLYVHEHIDSDRILRRVEVTRCDDAFCNDRTTSIQTQECVVAHRMRDSSLNYWSFSLLLL